ncbi:MAG: LptF/LptG family permease [Planctomycetota bacterium]
MSAPIVCGNRVLFRYLLRELTVAVLWAVAVIILVLLPGFAIRAAHHFDFNGIGRITTLYILPALLPQSLMLAIPLGAMIGALLVFSRMQASGEILAIRAGGGSFKLFVRPTLVIGAVLMVMYLALVTWGLDYSYSAMSRIVRNRTYDVIVSQLQPGSAYRFNKAMPDAFSDSDAGKGDQTILLLTLLPETPAGRQPVNISVFQADHSLSDRSVPKTELRYSIVAADHRIDVSKNEQGLPDVLTLSLSDVRQTLHQSSPDVILSMQFGKKTLEYRFGTEMERKSSLPLGRSMMSVGENIKLANESAEAEAAYRAEILKNGSTPVLIDRADTEARNVRRYRAEASRKIVTAFSIPVLMLLGIGFALMVSKSSPFIGFIAGLIGFGLGFFPLMSIGMQLGKNGVLDAWLSPALSVVVLIPIAWLLIRRGLILRGPGVLTLAWERVSSVFRKRRTSPATANHATSGQQTPAIKVRWRMRWLPWLSVSAHHLTMSFFLPCAGAGIGIMLIFIGVDFIDNMDRVFSYLGDSSNVVPFFSRLRIVAEYYALRGLFWGIQFGAASILIGAMLSVVVAKRNGELIILRTAGRSLPRAYLPVVILAALLSIAFNGINEIGGKPIARAERLRRWQMRDRLPPTDDGFSIVSRSPGGMTALLPAQFDSDAKTIDGFAAVAFNTNGDQSIVRISAPRAVWDETQSVWRFPDGGYAERFASSMTGAGDAAGDDRLADSMTETYIIERKTEMADAAAPEMAQFKQTGVSGMSLTDLARLESLLKSGGDDANSATVSAEIAQRTTEFFIAPIALLICLSFLFGTESRSTVGGVGSAILVCGLFIAGRPAVNAVASAFGISALATLIIWLFIVAFLVFGIKKYNSAR